jgi:serine/threonine protein kinase
MAEIYKARLEGIGGFQRTFAIKRILPNLSQNSEYIGMLVDEAKVAGLLSHANIVQILDLGQVDGIWYIAMEYVHGRDLGGVLRRAESKGLCLPVPHSVFIAIELLKGLEYAHQRQVMRGGRPVALNIVHRDVSPPNILLSYQGEVKLTDFGIARASLRVLETQAGVVKGRFDYMSPEQASAVKDLDQRSDLFTVGVVLYLMLTGRHPFRADTELGTIEKVRAGEYPPISQINPEVPFILETIVDRALRVDRNERYPTATAFKEALDKFFHDAGFLFTHATLALYVKGLFPEAERRPDGPSPQAEEPPTEPGELTLDDDPTGRMDAKALTGAPASLGLAPSAALDDWGADDDQETVIRKAPTDMSDAGQSMGTGNFGPDDPTAIRPVPVVEGLDSLGRDAPGVGAVSDKGPEAVIRPPHVGYDPTSEGIDLEEPLRIGGSRGEARKGRTTTGSLHKKRVGVGYLGWIVAACGVIVGLLTGLVVGATLALAFAGSSLSPLPARLTVEAPPGTTILLDGEAVMGETEIALGTHRLEIKQRGRSPIIRDFEALAGQERVFLVEQVKQ